MDRKVTGEQTLSRLLYPDARLTAESLDGDRVSFRCDGVGGCLSGHAASVLARDLRVGGRI